MSNHTDEPGRGLSTVDLPVPANGSGYFSVFQGT